jgi:hypothetical protein
MRSILLLLFIPITMFAQILGGERSMEFLQLSQSAHVTAMGGYCVNALSRDASFFTANPALLSEGSHSHLQLNYNSFYAKSRFLSSNYVHHLAKAETTLGFAIQYLNHGEMKATDASGNVFGNIRANEYTMQMSAARTYKGKIRYGTTLKFANSRLDIRTASALLLDFGVTYTDTLRNWYIGGVFKNAGVRLRNYESGVSQPLPFDLQIGIYKKFDKAPFAIYVIGHHLYTWDIRYDNPADQVNNQLIFGDTSSTQAKSYFADKLFRHVNAGVALHLGKKMEFNFAYNHLRRMELSLAERRAMSGFSMGLTIYLPKLTLTYARGNYHLSGAQNEIGLSMKLDKLFGIDVLKGR